jgi:hypothetical protein
MRAGCRLGISDPELSPHAAIPLAPMAKNLATTTLAKCRTGCGNLFVHDVLYDTEMSFGQQIQYDIIYFARSVGFLVFGA